MDKRNFVMDIYLLTVMLRYNNDTTMKKNIHGHTKFNIEFIWLFWKEIEG